MKNNNRKRVQSVVAALLGILCLLIFSVVPKADTEDWVRGYASGLAANDKNRILAFVPLCQNSAPELVEVAMDEDSTAHISVYHCSGKTVQDCVCDDMDLWDIEIDNCSSAGISLYRNDENSCCVVLNIKSSGSTLMLALTGTSSNHLQTEFYGTTSGNSYTLNGAWASKDSYQNYLKQFQSEFKPVGGAYPTANSRAGSNENALAKTLKNLAGKYRKAFSIKKIKISEKKLAMKTDDTHTLEVQVTPASAILAAKPEWRSSDTNVVTVDDTGCLTAEGSGNAVISCSVGSKKASCKVQVRGTSQSNAKVTAISLNMKKALLGIGESVELEVQFKPEGAETNIRWSSSSPRVCAVDSNGNVTGITVGTSMITAKTPNGKTAKCRIKVKKTIKNGLIVDISEHDNPSLMEWPKIKKNVSLLILRCGVTRTYTNPIGIGKDKYFDAFVQKCREYKIPFGVYYYGKCATVEEAREEARFTWKVASPFKPLFYVYDAEEDCLDKEKCEAYIKELKSLGAKKTGYYIANHQYAKYKLNTSVVNFVWIPRYGSTPPTYSCDLWQYTESGKVDGIPGYCDLNRVNGKKSLSWFLH